MNHPSTPPDDRPARRDRDHRGLLGWSALLFLCLFLPALDGCESEVYPVQALVELGPITILILPYLLSLPLALIADADREQPGGVPLHRRWLALLVTLIFAGTGLLILEPILRGYLVMLIPAAVWAIPIPILVRTTLSRRLTDARRAARWRALCGAGLFAYFLFWFVAVELEGAHAGLYLAMFASLGIAHNGYRLERSLADDRPALAAARARYR
jgi:hypothetical protein